MNSGTRCSSLGCILFEYFSFFQLFTLYSSSSSLLGLVSRLVSSLSKALLIQIDPGCPKPPWTEAPDPKIKKPWFLSPLRATPMRKWASGLSDLRMEIWMTGTSALGYMIMRGMKTPWSQPRLVLLFSSTPSFLSSAFTWLLSSLELAIGQVRLQVSGGKPWQSQQRGGASWSRMVHSCSSQCAEKSRMALGCGCCCWISWNCLQSSVCSSLQSRGMGPPPWVTKTLAIAISLGNNNDKHTNLPLPLSIKLYFF